MISRVCPALITAVRRRAIFEYSAVLHDHNEVLCQILDQLDVRDRISIEKIASGSDQGVIGDGGLRGFGGSASTVLTTALSMFI
jgi:hypothetical protein